MHVLKLFQNVLLHALLPLPKDFAAISIKNQKELEVVTAEYSNVQQQLIQHEKKDCNSQILL